MLEGDSVTEEPRQLRQDLNRKNRLVDRGKN
ncbi:hypothetical protein ES708_06771 [subsurface metagenome]